MSRNTTDIWQLVETIMEEERRRQSKGVQSKLTISRLEKTVKKGVDTERKECAPESNGRNNPLTISDDIRWRYQEKEEKTTTSSI